MGKVGSQQANCRGKVAYRAPHSATVAEASAVTRRNSALIAFDQLLVRSPKRAAHVQSGWDGFFPYYDGYPEQFARTLLESARLPEGAMILDPWNGSGTTTYAASQLGYTSRGLDLNPVMNIVARAPTAAVGGG